MKSTSLFLTGGTGFFGRSILQWMVDSGLGARRLTVLSRNPNVFLDACPQFKDIPNLSFIQGDIRSFEFPNEKFDAILHAATPASQTLEEEKPDEMYSIIVDGTHHVLDFAKQCDCKRFLMTSSGAVYGVQPPELPHIPETFPCNPVSVYGKGKLAAEQLCIAAGEKHGFAALLPRCFAFVGPHLPLNSHFAIGNFIRDCLNNRPIMINGDGTPIRSYLYADDLVEWLFKILLHGAHGRPYNVGSEDALSIFDLACLVRGCAGTTNEVIVCQKAVENQAPSRYIPSMSRAKLELDLGQSVRIEEAICRTLIYHQNKDSL